jgi:hypothetical protein
MVSVLPWLNWVLQLRILKSLLPSDKDQLGLGKIMGFVYYIISLELIREETNGF